jgi:hypothetical protein
MRLIKMPQLIDNGLNNIQKNGTQVKDTQGNNIQKNDTN